MKTLPIFVLLVFSATVLLAHQGVKDPDVMKRMEAMKASKTAFNLLGDMAKGTQAFDQEEANQARLDLIGHSSDYIALFEKPATDPKSEALPIIWTSFPDFTKRAQNMALAFEALDVSSLAALRAGLAEAGNSCLSCHQSFRKKKD